MKLAEALGVPTDEVGPKRIRLSDSRTKDFDCCWPLTGEPKILISVKSMQNAYRNLTNRIEEAYGDLAVLRLYGKEAVFGFLYVILDGPVARGEIGQMHGPSGRMRPFTALVEQGGDFLENPPTTVYSKKADTIAKGAAVLLDMISPEPIKDPLNSKIFYDSIAFIPTRFERSGASLVSPEGWNPIISPVPDELDQASFFIRLVEAAEIRGLLRSA
jgi:hypothetical protein